MGASKLQFATVYCTGADDCHPASELNRHTPSSVGWVTQRFCTFPQEVIIDLERICRIRMIQLLIHERFIPQKIELSIEKQASPGHQQSVGPPEILPYTPLGKVSLAVSKDNDKLSRELKSIHIDACGRFIRLSLNKPHINKHNLYNQVGLIAINVIGSPIDDIPQVGIMRQPSTVGGMIKQQSGLLQEQTSFMQDEITRKNQPSSVARLNTNTSINTDPHMWGVVNRPNYIEPADELGFDMYRDETTSNLLRILRQRKNEAVHNERYMEAKHLKKALLVLEQAGEQILQLEIAKKRAVDTEDYDTAETIKIELDRFRKAIYAHAGINPLGENEIPLSAQKSPSPTKTPAEKIEDSISALNVLKNEIPPQQELPPDSEDFNHEEIEEENIESHIPNQIEEDERPLQNNQNQMPTEYGERQTKQLETLNERQLVEYSDMIELFGKEVPQKVLSKSPIHREEGLIEISKMIFHLPGHFSESHVTSVINDCLIHLVKDPSFLVFTALVNVFDSVMEYLNSKNNTHQMVQYAQMIVPLLLERCGDSSTRTRESITRCLVKFCSMGDELMKCICQLSLKDIAGNNWKIQKGKITCVQEILQVAGINSNGYELDSLMNFTIANLKHSKNEVRESSLSLFSNIYKLIGDRPKIEVYLKEKDTLRSTRAWMDKVYDAMDVADGLGTKKMQLEREKQAKKNFKKAKKEEVEALSKQLAEIRAAAAAVNSGNKPPTANSSQLRSSINDTDCTCIFCGKFDKSFSNEDAVNEHYFSECPVLMPCPHCSEIVEVLAMNEHLLEECTQSSKFIKCNTCGVAVLKTSMDIHKKSNCKAPPPDMQICYLCGDLVNKNDDVARIHLLDICRQNKRNSTKF